MVKRKIENENWKVEWNWHSPEVQWPNFGEQKVNP